LALSHTWEASSLIEQYSEVPEYELLNMALAHLNGDRYPEILIGVKEYIKDENWHKYKLYVFSIDVVENGTIAITLDLSESTHVGKFRIDEGLIIMPTIPTGLYSVYRWNGGEKKYTETMWHYNELLARAHKVGDFR
jgi:hypothetical protein